MVMRCPAPKSMPAAASWILKSNWAAAWMGWYFRPVKKQPLALRYQELYERERDVYLRLHENGIEKLNGFAIPRYISHHDELLVVEMQIVSPPFVVDFAGARLDSPTPFSDEDLEEWEAERTDLFGEKKWDEVCMLLAALRRYGIYLSDVKPGNITFETEDQD
jgi:hypothetical protein